MRRPSTRLTWIAAQLALGAFGLAAFAANGNVWLGVALMALMLGSIVAFELANRRGLAIAGLVTGIGDERVRSIYRAATADTGEFFSYVLGVWLIVVVARGKTDDTLSAVCFAYAALWAVNVLRAAIAARFGATPRQAP